ncbi:MAG TPA: hypothetical protein VHT91_25810 [Kofleriaceae bacterium]|jgi:hypothetical protein|nr:hypothetical protein [Kofleriaceae bacterium]
MAAGDEPLVIVLTARDRDRGQVTGRSTVASLTAMYRELMSRK